MDREGSEEEEDADPMEAKPRSHHLPPTDSRPRCLLFHHILDHITNDEEWVFHHILDYITQSQSTNNPGKIGLSALVVAIATVVRNRRSIRAQWRNHLGTRRYGEWILQRLHHFCNRMALSSRRSTTTYRKPNGKSFQFVVPMPYSKTSGLL